MLGAFIVPHPPILLPEIGKGEEKQIENTARACREAMKAAAALKPDTVVLTSPHSVLYADYFHISPGDEAEGDFGAFGAPRIRLAVSYDGELREAVCKEADRIGLAAGTSGERRKKLDHGTMIPLRFLNEWTRDYRLVRIGLSGLPLKEHYRLGQCIRRACEQTGKRVVLIASGDLSHRLTTDGPYGFSPEGPAFDRQVTEAMKNGDFLKFLSFSPPFREKAAECGLGSFAIMAGALDGERVESRFLSYEGPFGVGYAVCCFYPRGKAEDRRFDEIYEKEAGKKMLERRSREDAYVRLARETLEAYVRTGRAPFVPEGLPEEMYRRQAGTFVSIKKDGQLRGCIGTIRAVTGCVAEEIVRNAVSAGTEDPRFPPVAEEELSGLIYSVDVLGETEPADETELDVKKYGVIVNNGSRRGLLLPNLEGVETVEEQLSIARRKAGIGPNEPAALERFEVVRHV